VKEIEVKFLEIDAAKLQKRLRKLGAKKILDATVDTVMFDFLDNRLAKKGESLRLRQAGDHIFITHKRLISKKKFKMQHETEFDVSDWHAIKKTFHAIGLVETSRKKKHRISWKLKGVRIEIDKSPGIPTYAELEGHKVAIINVAKLLGLNMKDAKPWSGPEMWERYRVGKKPMASD